MDVNDLITTLVPGRSFADLGGLWGTVNERITPALRAGCASATMIDEQTAGNYLWQAFDSHCAAQGLTGYASICGNLDDPALPAQVGKFDVLHCSGVIYHCPSPYYSLQQLRRMTGQHLLLGSMIVPEKLSNAAGSLDFSEGRMIAVPAMRGTAQAVVRRHFDDFGLVATKINFEDGSGWFNAEGTAQYGPWWWLFTVETLAAMAEAAGFIVRATWEHWEGRAYYLHCEVPA